MKRLALCTLLAAAAVLAAPRAHAAYTLTLSQSGTNLVATGSGSLNTTALTLANANNNTGSTLQASLGWLYLGPGVSVGALYDGLSGPTTFGAGTARFFGAGTGSLVGVYNGFGSELQVPQNYVSGTALGTSTASFANASLASAGLTPGSYVYTWGAGANADSFTININAVPEPGTWAMMALGVAGLGVVALRRRAARHA